MTATWFERLSDAGIEVHPAAGGDADEIFRMMTRAETEELGADIKKNGLTSPIVLWTPLTMFEAFEQRRKPIPKFLLDGRNRLAAIELAYADDAEEFNAAFEAAIVVDDGRNRGGARLLYGDVDPWEYVISANVHRRHLTGEQKRDLVVKLLKARPERSDRATATIAKVSDKTVARVRNDLADGAEIPHHAERVGRDGVKQPAAKPPKQPSKADQIRALRERSAPAVVVRNTAAPLLRPTLAETGFEAQAARFIDAVADRRAIFRSGTLDQRHRLAAKFLEEIDVAIEGLERFITAPGDGGDE